MRVRTRLVIAIFLFGSLFVMSNDGNAQMVRNRNPLQRSGSSFSERIGVGFGFNIRGSNRIRGIDQNGNFTPNGDIRFRQGAPAVPNVGGFNPNAAARTGFGISGRNGDAFFNLTAAQGSRRTNSVQSPSVTTLNGYPGFFSAGSQRPFVTSVIPVVGDFNSPLRRPGGHSVLQQKLRSLQTSGTSASHQNSAQSTLTKSSSTLATRLTQAKSSTAGQGDLSLAEITKQQQLAAEQPNREAFQYFQKALSAEKSGKLALAKNYLRMAKRTATGDLRYSILEKLKQLSVHSAVSRKNK